MPTTAEKPVTQTTVDAKATTDAKETTQKQEPTPEQKAAAIKGRDKLHGDMFLRAKRPEKSEKTDAKEAKNEKQEKAIAEVPEKPEEKKEEKTETAPAKKVLKPKPAKEPVDLERLVQSTVEATAKAVKAEPKQEKAEKELPKENVPKRRQAEWDAIAKAEASGATHKGAAASAAEVFRAEDEYIRKWESENPNRKFNAKASEHDDWYERNLPEWVEEASDAGAEAVKLERIEQRLLEKLEKEKIAPLKDELTNAQLREKQREIELQAPQHVASSLGMAISAINPDLLKEGTKIEEADPLAHEILLKVGPEIAAETHEALMLFATDGRSYSKENELHQRIIDTAQEMEKEIAAHTDEEKTDPSGRTFITRAEWNNLSEAQQKKHWIVNGPLVAMKLAAKQADKAKALYASESAKLEKLAIARGWTTGKVSNGTEKNGHAEESEHEEAGAKPRSPSTAATTVIKPGAKTEVKVAQNGADRLVASMFAR